MGLALNNLEIPKQTNKETEQNYKEMLLTFELRPYVKLNCLK